MISVTIPLRTVSEANRHEHWRARQKRAKGQRTVAELVVRAQGRIVTKGFGLFFTDIIVKPLTVTITRLSPRQLDSDNLASSQKHVRDGVADALGIDDRDPRVTWLYAQEKAKTYGVRIEIRRREA